MRRALIALFVLLLLAVGLLIAVGEALSHAALRDIGHAPSDIPFVSVRIPTTDSQEVAGWFVRGKPSHGAILLLHGVRSDRRQMLGRARFLFNAGYSTLLIDLPAHGKSVAKNITFGANEAAGVIAGIGYLRQKMPEENIGVIGVSLGAAALVLADANPAPDAVVLESMYPTITEAVENRLAIRFGAIGKMLSPLLLWQIPFRLGVTTDQLQPIAQIGSLRSPVLIASGTRDKHTPMTETRRIFQAANYPKELWSVAGASHVDLYAFDPVQYKAKTLPFFAKYLPQKNARHTCRANSGNISIQSMRLNQTVCLNE